MSLINHLNSNNSAFEDVDPGYISEAAMAQLESAIVMESLNPDEIDQYIAENTEMGAVTEAQKNIVRLNKAAQKQKWYKIGVLQCAAEAGQGKGDKDYRKLRKLWKIEAKLFKRLEAKYKNKAMAKARESMKNAKKKKGMVATAADRAQTMVQNVNNTIQKHNPITKTR